MGLLESLGKFLDDVDEQSGLRKEKRAAERQARHESREVIRGLVETHNAQHRDDLVVLRQRDIPVVDDDETNFCLETRKRGWRNSTDAPRDFDHETKLCTACGYYHLVRR